MIISNNNQSINLNIYNSWLLQRKMYFVSKCPVIEKMLLVCFKFFKITFDVTGTTYGASQDLFTFKIKPRRRYPLCKRRNVNVNENSP